jgi:leucyl-tRNA synthetase
VTYIVLAPEHPLVTKITTGDHHAEVDTYIEETKKKSDIQRTHLEKEKTGVFTGAYAINPVNGKKIPIYISDYVLSTYGTGAIMAVPAHDERDFAFAKKYKIEIIPVLKTTDGKNWDYEKDGALSAEGIAINSGEFDGLTTDKFKEKISEWLEQKKIGKKTIQYKLRDWVFSRQRYWGEPIPIYFPVKIEAGLDPKKDAHEILFDQPIAVDEKDLPLKLPDLDDFKPGNDPAGPLAKALDWRYFEKDGKWYARETNTMPQWAGSSWYFLRYIDAKNDQALADEAKLKYWLPVDVYIGGAEHAVLHLLYARFWHKFLFDEKIVNTSEPFIKLRNQGLILAEDGNKMSKSRGNVVNPDEVIAEHGADCLRMYEMFMGPLEQAKPWSTKGMMGVHRFIDKIWRLSFKPLNNNPLPEASEKILHKTIKKVGEDIESESFNTAISTMMELVNDWTALEQLNKPAFENFLKILTPFAPHLTEEVWEKLGHKPSIYKESWPDFDAAKLQDNQTLVVFQVNGKVRAKEMLETNLTNAQLEAKAKEHDNVRAHIDGKEIVKIITVPKKLVNIVVK